MLRPSTSRGLPALGWADRGRLVTASIRSIVSSIGAGPTAQLTPITVAPRCSSSGAKRSGGVPSDIAGVDASLFRYAQICDATAVIPTATADLIREARTGRLLPGAGALPLRDLVAALPAAIPLAIEAPVLATTGLPALERAQRAYRSMRALLG